MYRFLSLLAAGILLFTLLPLSASAEDVIPFAEEIAVLLHDSNDREAGIAPLQDVDDATGLALKKGANAVFFLLLPEDVSCESVYLRLSSFPVLAELQKQSGRKNWETVSTLENPGCEFVFPAGGVSGKLRILLSFFSPEACFVKEARCFAAGELPVFLHPLSAPREADILIAAESPEAMNTDLIAGLSGRGLKVSVAFLTDAGLSAAATDRLWAAGLRTAPYIFRTKAKKPDPAAALAGFIRKSRPLMLVTDGYSAPYAEGAVASAADMLFDMDGAAETGVWVVPVTCDAAGAPDKAASLPERSNDAVRAWCAAQFETAVHADPAVIPYPASRQEDGYLPDGEPEFIYDDPEAGLWAYLNQTLQVEIVKYQMPEVPHTWFEAFVTFRPDQESFRQHTYVNAEFPNQQIWPETLAQTSKLVFAVNGDYYLDRKTGVRGNIIRQRTIIDTYDASRKMKYPNLDCAALRDDGSMSVYSGAEITAEELLSQGNVHDVLSFGPYLVRDGEMRVYNGNSAENPEPRCAYGMIAPGRYFFVMVEGKMPKKGEQGFTLWTLAELMYARGCEQAFNTDGGSTSVMIFMGRKLNRTGKATSLGSPRNQHELFGIGSSDQVYTDMVNGKPKK